MYFFFLLILFFIKLIMLQEYIFFGIFIIWKKRYKWIIISKQKIQKYKIRNMWNPIEVLSEITIAVKS